MGHNVRQDCFIKNTFQNISLIMKITTDSYVVLLNQYISARAAQIGTVALLCSVPPGRAQREPQGYAGFTICSSAKMKDHYKTVRAES